MACFGKRNATGKVALRSSTVMAVEYRRFGLETDLKLSPNKAFIESAVFTSVYSNCEWQILLKPNFVDHTGTKFLSIYLRLVKSDAPCVHVTASFSLLPCFNSVQTYSKGCALNAYTLQTPCFGLDRFIEMYRLVNGEEGKFRFVASLAIFVPETSIERQILHPAAPPPLEPKLDATVPAPSSPELKTANKQQGGDLPEVVLDGLLSTGSGAPIPVDTRRLSRYSQIFADYFIGESSKSRPFDISDYCTDKGIIREICSFCYTEEVTCSKNESRVLLLLKTAHFLGMDLLVSKIQAQVLENLSVESFVVAVSLSQDLALEPSATPVIMDFLLKNFDELKENERYKDTLADYAEYYFTHLICDSAGEGGGPLLQTDGNFAENASDADSDGEEGKAADEEIDWNFEN